MCVRFYASMTFLVRCLPKCFSKKACFFILKYQIRTNKPSNWVCKGSLAALLKKANGKYCQKVPRSIQYTNVHTYETRISNGQTLTLLWDKQAHI